MTGCSTSIIILTLIIGTEAHHIVSGVADVGKANQNKLRALGIDFNSPMNGVFLPGCGKSKAIGMIHCGRALQRV